jgi:hypothetical protein
MMGIKTIQQIMKEAFGIELPDNIESYTHKRHMIIPLSEVFCLKTGMTEKEFAFDIDDVRRIVASQDNSFSSLLKPYLATTPHIAKRM